MYNRKTLVVLIPRSILPATLLARDIVGTNCIFSILYFAQALFLFMFQQLAGENPLSKTGTSIRQDNGSGFY
jgi:hypothetical protein